MSAVTMRARCRYLAILGHGRVRGRPCGLPVARRAGIGLGHLRGPGLRHRASWCGRRVRVAGQAMRGPSRCHGSRRMTDVAPISPLDPPTVESLYASTFPSRCSPLS